MSVSTWVNHTSSVVDQWVCGLCEVATIGSCSQHMCTCFQDVDSAYLVKADLEDKVGALTDEINFLRNVYEEVCLHVFKPRLYVCVFLVASMYSLHFVSSTPFHDWKSASNIDTIFRGLACHPNSFSSSIEIMKLITVKCMAIASQANCLWWPVNIYVFIVSSSA